MGGTAFVCVCEEEVMADSVDCRQREKVDVFKCRNCANRAGVVLYAVQNA